MSMDHKPKILSLDLERAPAKVYTWSLFDQVVTIDRIIEDTYILCWSAKWLHEKRIMESSILEGKKTMLKKIRALMNEADIIVAHNGNGFDFKVLNMEFVNAGLKPYSMTKKVDTRMALKRIGVGLSTKLDYLIQKFKLGAKLSSGGFQMWIRCMNRDKDAMVKMMRYCRHDTKLVERLYLKLRPYMDNHPNLNVYAEGGSLVCPNCGSNDKKKEGIAYTSTNKFQRYSCLDCGKYYRGANCIKGGKGREI